MTVNLDLENARIFHELNDGGTIRAALVEYGFSVEEADGIYAIGKIQGGELWDCVKKDYIGKYQYYDGIEKPLFYFQDQKRMEQKIDIIDGVPHPKLRLNTYVHGTPALVITGEDATAELHNFISWVGLSCRMDEPGYKLSKASGAFFQGGSADRDGKFIYIEFWIFKGAQAFVDFVNEEYPKWYKSRVNN